MIEPLWWVHSLLSCDWLVGLVAQCLLALVVGRHLINVFVYTERCISSEPLELTSEFVGIYIFNIFPGGWQALRLVLWIFLGTRRQLCEQVRMPFGHWQPPYSLRWFYMTISHCLARCDRVSRKKKRACCKTCHLELLKARISLWDIGIGRSICVAGTASRHKNMPHSWICHDYLSYHLSRLPASSWQLQSPILLWLQRTLFFIHLQILDVLHQPI